MSTETTMPPRRHPLLHTLLLLAACAATLAAQAPLTLDQMEAIYRRELSERHIPLISRYLIELQRQAAIATDPAPWRQEIVRVQELLKTGGVIDLAMARAAIDNIAAPMLPAPSPREAVRAALTLAPAQATGSLAAAGQAVPVGEIRWLVEFLPAGAYDVHIQYACPAISSALPLRMTLAGGMVEAVIDSTRLTKDAQTFRVLKVGRITLPAEVRGQTLTFTCDDKSSTALRLKQLIITPAKPPS